ncbi:MAG: hypothetical protein PHE68_04875 [Candidatus Peribacteraceae bacterium]|nr:hypothetical protein [Candidatus Peribacteraceae bacterium]MDD5074785.1 hypothetical protein [Candidatus Peribacteraceae bacterium]
MGEVAHQIASDEWGEDRLSFIAGIAGLCHNADRVIQKQLNVGRRDVPRESVVASVTAWLQDCRIVAAPTIVEIVLGHDGRNSPQDSKALIALMDADRVVNLDADLFIRSAQHYHDIVAVDYYHFLDDPSATYRDPKSVLRDIAYSLEWADPASPVCVRTRLGRKMAQERARVFRTFIEALQGQLTGEGVFPFTL